MKISELLLKPERWTQKYYARDRQGLPVPATSENAICWCLHGAIRRCYPNTENMVYSKVAAKTTEQYNCGPIAFNDNATYEEVISLVKEMDI